MTNPIKYLWCLFVRAYHHFDGSDRCLCCGIGRGTGPRFVSHVHTFEREVRP